MHNLIPSLKEDYRTGSLDESTHLAQFREPHENGSRRESLLVHTLGWFSVGLGLAALSAPHKISEYIGIRHDHDTLLRLWGLREIVSGVGILTQSKSRPWIWSRVAGDFLDLALLGKAVFSKNSDRTRLTAATAAVAGLTMLDIACARRLKSDGNHLTERGATTTINRPREEVYRFWRDLENLPQFMSHLISIQVTTETLSHWVAAGPAGKTVEWDAEIILDLPNELIAWRSRHNDGVENAGTVRFKDAPGGRGTEVHVRIAYHPPGGNLGKGVAMLFGKEPGQQIKGDLYRFKQVMETGEVLHSDSSIHRGLHSARPPEYHRALPNRPLSPRAEKEAL